MTFSEGRSAARDDLRESNNIYMLIGPDWSSTIIVAL